MIVFRFSDYSRHKLTGFILHSQALICIYWIDRCPMGLLPARPLMPGSKREPPGEVVRQCSQYSTCKQVLQLYQAYQSVGNEIYEVYAVRVVELSSAGPTERVPAQLDSLGCP